MGTTIRRNQVLQELDIKEDPYGNQIVFSIQFDKINGERVFYPRAVSCGLNMHLSKNRTRGALPIDAKGSRIGHPTPIGIDRIIRFNGSEVLL